MMHIKYIFNGTHTSTALKFVRENSFSTAAGDRPNVPNFLIFWDAHSNLFYNVYLLYIPHRISRSGRCRARKYR
jgi:hypothetical protein